MLNVVIFIRWTSVWLIIPITTHRFQRLGRTLVIILARLVFSATFSSIWINASGTVTALFWGGPKDRTSPTEKTSVATSSSIFLEFFLCKEGLINGFHWISTLGFAKFANFLLRILMDFAGIFCLKMSMFWQHGSQSIGRVLGPDDFSSGCQTVPVL